MTATQDDMIAELQRSNAELRRERDENRAERNSALAQKAALAEVLDVINRCPGDPGPVFDAILEKAHALCGATIGALAVYDGEFMRAVAVRGLSAENAALVLQPYRPSPGGIQRLIAGARFNQIVDTRASNLSGFGKMFTERTGLQTYLGIPLRKDGAFVGQISAYRTEVRPFSKTEIALLENFAAQAVIAMENARLLGELRERTGELAERNTAFAERIAHQAATIDVLKAMSASPADARPALETIVRRAWALCGEQSAIVYSVDGPMMDLVLYHRPNLSAEQAEELRSYFPSPVERSIMAPAITERRILHIRDIDAWPGTWEVARRFFRSAIWVPMLRGETVIGLIGIDSLEKGGFSDTQTELLRTFAEQAVIAITSAETFRALQTRTADLQESLAYQTATSDVLKAISRSTFDLQPVLDTLITTAARLCEAENAFLMEREGDLFRAKATFAVSPPAAAILQSLSLKMDRGTITGRAALEGRAVQIEDVTTDPDYALAQTVSVARNRTLLSVPLLRQGVVVGAITLGRQRVQTFTDQQIALVSTFADQAVIAIENTRLLTEQREALERQTATSELLQVINASPGNLQPVFDTMLEKAHSLCDATLGGLMIWDGTHIRAVATHGFPDQFAARLRQGFPPSRASQSLLDGARLFHIPDAMADAPDPRAQGVQETGARTALMIPLRKDGAFLGYISSFRKEVRPFSDKEIALLENFAAQAVIAMENARLLNEQREALERQTATAEVLRTINANPGNIVPVFDAMLEKAAVLCDAECGSFFMIDGDTVQAVVTRGLPAEYHAELTKKGAVGPQSGVARVAHGEDVVHLPDMRLGPSYLAGEPFTVRTVDVFGLLYMARRAIAQGWRRSGLVRSLPI